MCQSRGYKRGYLGVYPKVDIKGVNNPKRYRVIDNSDIEEGKDPLSIILPL